MMVMILIMKIIFSAPDSCGKLKYTDRKIRAKCNFATLKNFMTC